MPDQAAIAVNALRVVRGGRRVLHEVGLEVPAGRITGLLGPSGCGKSTLMRSIVGVQVVASGTVTVLGQPAGSKGLRARVGYVTQAPSVYQDLTVEQNLRYFAGVLGAGRGEVDLVVETVSLGEYAGRASTGCRAASGHACRWRRRCSTPLSCWCWTSRPSASTRCCGGSCGAPSGRWPTAA